MTVAELIILLEELPGDYEVRMAIQPSYPLQFRVNNVVHGPEVDVPDVVYIVQGDHPYDDPYASSDIWEM